MEIFIPYIKVASKVASTFPWAFLVAQRLKRLPPMLETQVWSLGREDPLEKEMVTHSSILAWRIPWTEKPGRLQSLGSQKSDTTERLHLHLSFFIIIIIFYCTILYWFCHTSTCIHHGCTRVPHPEPPSLLSAHTIPLSHPSAPALSFLYPALNLDWQFIFYMILCMF